MIAYENLLKKTRVYEALKQDVKLGNISHCIMIVSEDEIACKSLCKIVTRMLLCDNGDCGICKDCKAVENDTHEGVVTPATLDAKGLKNFIAQSYIAVDAKAKVLLIDNFQDIALKEQNRLLKLIEEPIGNAVFVIGVSHLAAVLDTIKSRATKYTLAPFTNEEIREALLEKYDAYSVDNAMKFADGSLTKAIYMMDNVSFVDSYNFALNTFRDLENSAYLLDIVAKSTIKNKRTLNEKQEQLLNYLKAFEIVLKQVIEYKSGINDNVEDIIKEIDKKYNMATLVNVEDLILKSVENTQNNCDPDGVFYQLLMDILEVRFKCQI